MLTAALEALVVDLDSDHGETVAGEHLGDPGAHRAEPDHSDGGELAGRRGGIGCGGAHGAHPPTRSARPTARFLTPLTTALDAARSAGEGGHVVGTAPRQGDARHHRGRSSGSRRRPARDGSPGRAGRSPTLWRSTRAPARAGTSAVPTTQDVGGGVGSRRAVPLPRVLGTPDHDVAAARDHVRRAVLGQPPLLEARPARPRPPARARGSTDGSPASVREPSPEQFDHQGTFRQVGQRHAGSRCLRRPPPAPCSHAR